MTELKAGNGVVLVDHETIMDVLIVLLRHYETKLTKLTLTEKEHT